jgi:hypothetical protein
MKKLFNILFRLLFGLALIVLGMITLTEVNKLDSYVNSTIDQLQHKVLKKHFNITGLKQNSEHIVFFEAFLFLSSGLLTIFGFCFAKVFAFLAVLIELSLVHNIYFYTDQFAVGCDQKLTFNTDQKNVF